MSADITLAEGDDLTCTFFNQRATSEPDDHQGRIYLPFVRAVQAAE